MLDAPVSGAKAKAKDGTLALMVGGDPKLLRKVRPVLSKSGAQIFHTGGPGSGHATKALNKTTWAPRKRSRDSRPCWSARYSASIPGC